MAERNEYRHSIIPTPQDYRPMPGHKSFRSGKPVMLYARGEQDGTFAYAVEYLKRCARQEFALDVADAAGAADADIVMTDDAVLAGQVAGRELLSGLDRGKYADRQGYVLASRDGEPVVLCGKTGEGCLNAVATFLQMPEASGGAVLLQNAEVCDWPDFLHRGNKWLMGAEVAQWSYDFGDGIDACRRRFIEKLDMCVRYKVNVVFADALGWSSEKFPGYGELMLALNREARRRGIRIVSAGYGSSYGASAPGNGSLHTGQVHMNRRGYPDGEVYTCQAHRNLSDRPLVYGTCLSNEGLYACKERELTDFVRAVEPGALYLHNLDEYCMLDVDWTKRCPACREKWPNDDLLAQDGAAGAYAYFYNHIVRALNTVKKDGYDAERDLLVFLVSPGYTWYFEDDAAWDFAVKYWTRVGRLLECGNAVITLREQFYNQYAKPPAYATRRRYDLLRESLDAACPGVKTACIYFGGSDGFYSDRAFTSVPAYHYTQKGVDCLINACGHAFQEPLQLLNAETMWNSENSAFCAVPQASRPQNYFDMMAAQKAACFGLARPAGIFGAGGFLDTACAKLYGQKAGALMARVFGLAGINGLQPAAYLSSVDMMAGIFQLPPRASWHNELDDTEYGELLTTIREIRDLTREVARIASGIKEIPDACETVVFIAGCYAENCAHLDALCSYMELRGQLERHLKTGEGSAAALQAGLAALATAAEGLRVREAQSGLQAIDYMGASMKGRKNNIEFLRKNTAWMLECLRDGKRFPSEDMVKREWW